MGFEYSDGRRVEEMVTTLLRRTPRRGSGERIAEAEARRSWPVRYHLAPERANLLRHLDFGGLDVLELGAGMGGVSRYLAEASGHLTVVEGSSRRFAGLAERLRDLDNWSGWLGRIEELGGARRYDVVCLVGVLEYAESMVDVPEDFAGDAFEYLLQAARRSLKEDGILLVAIENRLGLKYWSGAAEDHSGTLFDGIAGYGERSVARTFARRELGALLGRVGCEVFEEYFPFPDYKLPASVLRAGLAEQDPDLAADLACFQPFADHRQRRSFLFPDYLALHHLARAGHFEDFANSFLVLAGAGGRGTFDRLTSGHGDLSDRLLAWHYSPRRRVGIETRFGSGVDGLWVEKACSEEATSGPRVAGEGLPAAAVPQGASGYSEDGMVLVWADPGRRAVVRGERLRLRLLGSLYFDSPQGFEDHLLAFLRWALERYDDGSGRVVGKGIDGLIRNAVCQDGSYELFDLEWRVEKPFERTWFVLRNVLSLVVDLPFLGGIEGVATLGGLYRHLCLRLELPPDLEADCRREASFQSEVSGRAVEDVAADLSTVLGLWLADHRMLPRDPQFMLHWRNLGEALVARDEAIRWLHRVRGDLEVSLASREQAIHWLEKQRAHESAELHGHLGDLHGRIAELERRLAEAQRTRGPLAGLLQRFSYFFGRRLFRAPADS